jgi:prepilin-type N-terminal cleavage/methylation domain-containing protein
VKREHAKSAGFTLIEILVVISIIGVLAGLVGVLITKARQSQLQTSTKQLVQVILPMKIESYKQEMGRYPASTLVGLQAAGGKVKLWKGVNFQPSNDTNEAIEVLVVQLRHPDFSKRLQDDELGAIEPPTGNIDEDEFTEQPAGSSNSTAVELLDSWGHPIIYLYNADYGKTVTVRNASGEVVEVIAQKKKDGTYYNPNKFQIISLGENGTQELDGDPTLWDDIYNFTPGSGE